MNRAVIFVRVSTGDQAKDERFSIPTQLRESREACGREEWVVVAEHVAPGRSASVSELERVPELLAAVRAIEAGQADVLVYHDSTRLARNNRLSNEVLHRVESAGGRLCNVQGSTDYHTPEGHAFFQMESTFATLQAEKIGEHSKKGKRGQFVAGIQVGQFPWPYRRDPNSRSAPPIVDPAEAIILGSIFDAFASGRGAREIARELTKQRARPPGPTGRWIPQTIQGMRANRYYLGEICHEGRWRPGNQQPLISEELFAAAQVRRTRAPRVNQWPPMLLQGVARCSDGHRLYPFRPGKGKNFPGVFYEYYRDPSRDTNRECSTGVLHWPIEEPDAAVMAVVRTLAMDARWLRYVDQKAREPVSDDATFERKELERKLQRAGRAWIDEAIPEDEYRAILESVNLRLAALPAAPVSVPPSLGRLQSFQQLWANGSAEFRNSVCRTIFERVVLVKEERFVELQPAPEFEPLLDLRASYVRETQPGPACPDVRRPRLYTLEELGVAV